MKTFFTILDTMRGSDSIWVFHYEYGTRRNIQSLLTYTMTRIENSKQWCNHIGGLNFCTGQYSTALEHLEKALTISQKFLPYNHPILQEIRMTTGMVYYFMGECSRSQFYFQTILEIHQESVLSNHPFANSISPYMAKAWQLFTSSSWQKSLLVKFLIRMTISIKKTTNTLPILVQPKPRCLAKRSDRLRNGLPIYFYNK